MQIAIAMFSVTDNFMHSNVLVKHKLVETAQVGNLTVGGILVKFFVFFLPETKKKSDFQVQMKHISMFQSER